MQLRLAGSCDITGLIRVKKKYFAFPSLSTVSLYTMVHSLYLRNEQHNAATWISEDARPSEEVGGES